MSSAFECKKVSGSKQENLANLDLPHQQKQLVSLDLESLAEIRMNSLKKEDFLKRIDFGRKSAPKDQIYRYFQFMKDELESFKETGLKAIKEGRVGVVVLAGGLSSELSVSYPKGVYSVDLLSCKSLFQLQAERLYKIQKLANSSSAHQIPWYIMTSAHTHQPTLDFFKENNYFSLNEENIVFFEQDSLPCFDEKGRIMLKERHLMFEVPNGNGGLYKAMIKHDIIEDMRRRGVEYIHVYGVENVLVKIADPTFTGFCVAKGLKCAAKVVSKSDISEPSNGLCYREGKLSVIDHSLKSDLKTQLLFDTDERNSIFNMADIGYYFLSFELLSELCGRELNFFRLTRNLLVFNEEKKTEEKRKCFVYEQFFTEILPSLTLFEVSRVEEYSPLRFMRNIFHTKHHCKEDLISLHLSWLVKAGAAFHYPDDPDTQIKDFKSGEDEASSDGLPSICEVSPLVSYAGEGLEELVKGKLFEPPLVLDFDLDLNKVAYNGIDFDAFDKAYPTELKVTKRNFKFSTF